MTYQKDQERKNKILTWISIGVLILAVLPIVLFIVFSVVTAKNPPVRNSSSIEEPTLSRSEQRKLEREQKKAEEAKAQTVTQNQPVITTETLPQPGQMPFGQGFGPGQFGQGQFGPGMMGPGQFGNFDPANMPQFDPVNMPQFGNGMGMGFGQFGQGFDPTNMPQFDPSQFQGMGMGFGQGMQFDPGQFQGQGFQMPQGGFQGMGQGGFPQGGFNGGGFQGGMNNANGGPNIIMTNPVQPAGGQQVMTQPLINPGN